MKQKIVLFKFICLALFFCGNQLNAQESESTDSLDISIKPYGSFRGHFAAYRDELEFQENASRVGFELGVKKNKFKFFATVELGMNLFKSNSQFNQDGNTSGGFLVIDNEQATQVFNSRLGYLGIDFEQWGRLSFGKQWSVFYDVTSYTDRFNIFGGRGSATYNAGTDGGSTGTGRADQSIIYRNDIGAFTFGAQLQAQNANNNYFFDGFGVSAQIKLMEGFKFGAAFVQSYVADILIDNDAFLGLDDQPTYFTTGFDYTNKHLELSGVFSIQSNGDLVDTIVELPDETFDSASIVYDAVGFEVRAKYKLRKLNFLAGYNYYEPDVEQFDEVDGLVRIDGDFGVREFILGLEYKPTKIAYFYGEARIANGKDALGLTRTDVFALRP